MKDQLQFLATGTVDNSGRASSRIEDSLALGNSLTPTVDI